jgi:ketosteroid isomerase-like protein
MSEADVRLFRSWIEQSAAAEDPLDFAYQNMWAEDIDHRAAEGAPDDHGPIIGRDAMRRYLGEWYEMFDGYKLAVEDVIDAGEGRVLIVYRGSGQARASGVPVDMSVFSILTIRDGKIVRGREYLTMDEALRAAGLSD